MSKPDTQFAQRQPGTILHATMVAITLALVGIAAFFLLESSQPLTRSQAASAVTSILDSEGPITVSFHTGLIKDQIAESARDPEYRFLEKAGIIEVVPQGNLAAMVGLTAKGGEFLKHIPGVTQLKEADGRELYEVPLANMRLGDIVGVKMSGRTHAVVNFNWKWDPNKMGEIFDASGAHMRQFSSGERSALIDFYGARFYRQAPTTASVSLVKTAAGWELEK